MQPQNPPTPPAPCWVNSRLKAIQDQIDARRQNTSRVGPQLAVSPERDTSYKPARSDTYLPEQQGPGPQTLREEEQLAQQRLIQDSLALEAEQRLAQQQAVPQPSYLTQRGIPCTEERKRAEQKAIEDTVASEAEERRRMLYGRGGRCEVSAAPSESYLTQPALTPEERFEAQKRMIEATVAAEAERRHAGIPPEPSVYQELVEKPLMEQQERLV